MQDGIYKWREIYRQWALGERIFQVAALRCEQFIPTAHNILNETHTEK